MKLNIFVWLVLALLAAGVTARTHTRASHSPVVGKTDPAFLKLDKEIRAQFPNVDLI